MQVAQNVPTVVSKNTTNFFQIIVVFFWRVVIKGAEKIGDKIYLTAILQETNRKTTFVEKLQEKRKKN